MHGAVLWYASATVIVLRSLLPRYAYLRCATKKGELHVWSRLHVATAVRKILETCRG